MQNQMFAELPPEERKRMLSDNCDRVENMGYMKPFTTDEIYVKKDRLAEVDIEIDGLEREKKDVSDGFAAQIKPLKIERKEILEGVKNKAEYVVEDCYIFYDPGNKKVGYYNAQGVLVSSRAMRPGEFQTNIFGVQRRDSDRTGTDD